MVVLMLYAGFLRNGVQKAKIYLKLEQRRQDSMIYICFYELAPQGRMCCPDHLRSASRSGIGRRQLCPLGAAPLVEHVDLVRIQGDSLGSDENRRRYIL